MDTIGERLWFVVKKALKGIGIFLLMGIGLWSIMLLIAKFDWAFAILRWTAYIMGGIVVLMLVLSVIMNIYSGLRWLIVGPNKNKPEEESDE